MEQAGSLFVKDIALEVAKVGIEYVFKNVKHVFQYKKEMTDMKDVVSRLVKHKLDIQTYISNEGRDDEVTHAANYWLSEVASLEARMQDITTACETKPGLHHVSHHFKLGRDSAKLLEKAKILESERIQLTIFGPSSVPNFSSKPREDFREYISSQDVLNRVINGLWDAEKSVLAIYGMPGIGKSTILAEIAYQMELQKVFDIVLRIELSQSTSFSEIQDLIAEQLGLSFRANSIGQKSSELARALRQKRSVLIMFDNVWTEIDLRKVGVPFGNDHKGCKVVIATRNVEVCNQMNVDAQFSVNLLSEEESWDLFKSKTGEVITMTEIEPIAKQVVLECGNLPLAIVVIGLALRGANGIDIWSYALRQLRQSNPKGLVNVEEKLFKCIQLSYEYLDCDKLKSLFLVFSLFPEGYEMSEDELVRFAIGENILGRFSTLEEARENMHMLVYRLRNSCLLLETRDSKVTKMHDVIRDVAVSIGSKPENGFYIRSLFGADELDQNLNQFKRISLLNTKISELPENPEACDLRIFMARNNTQLENIPTKFFRQMPVLTILDLSDSKIVALSSSIQDLRRLKVLCLNNCKDLQSISIIGQLGTLQILSLQRCCMKTLPKEIGMLIKLRLLDLSYSPGLIIEHNILSNLISLEELSLGTSSLFETVFKEIIFSEKLNRLQLCLEDSIFFSQEIAGPNMLKNTKRFVFCSDPSFVEMNECYKTIMHIKEIQNLANWVKVILSRTEYVHFDDCFLSANSLLEFEDTTGFANLRTLKLTKCNGIGCLLRSEDAASKNAFASLEELYLVELDNFVGVSKGTISKSSFSNMLKFHVNGCRNILTLLPYNLLVVIHYNLEELIVKRCEKLVHIFYFLSEECDMFPSLRFLYLKDLSQLANIWSGALLPEGSFTNLKELHVKGCGKLRKLVPARIVGSFHHLERLLISDNATLEEIVEHDGFQLDQNAFPRLKELLLENLPLLSNFYMRGSQFHFFSWPLLKVLKMEDCQNMKMFPIGNGCATHLEKIELVCDVDLVCYNRLSGNERSIASHFKLFVSGREIQP